MSLTSGTRLGSYQITGLIGVGGMGEVYRANDTKLGREVAIKTLPSELAKDADRLARFEREAKLLAALNHAHIAAIYGLHEHEGTQFLAMELVEGETLERKLKDARMPVEDVLRLALQIAEALEAAHEKGIVHRDLKPANIMITPDGQVKVLDFGLAKAFTADPKQTAVGHSPALSLAMTQQGLVLGTAGYMSPEQASGQATDQRADIWAFGVVLYEMLTGAPLFSGESVPHILADVLRTEPDWNRLPKNLHPRLRLLLERCLEKKPRNRCHSIADVRVDIEKVLSDPQGIAAAATAQPNSRRVLPLAAGVIVGIVLTGLLAWRLWPPTTKPPAVSRFDWAFPSGMGPSTGAGRDMALSPDGRYIAYASPTGLYLRSMSELEAQRIPGTEKEAASSPVFSPDSRSVAYSTLLGTAQIRRIAIGGGAPVVVADGVTTTDGGTWAPNNTLLVSGPDGISRVAAAGGKPELIVPAKAGEVYYGAQLLPGRDLVLFSVATTAPRNWDLAQVVVESLSTHQRTVLVEGGADARYVPPGHLLFARGDRLFSLAFDADTLTASGEPVLVAQDVLRSTFDQTGAANYDVSADGTLVFIHSNLRIGGDRYTLVWVDREGHEEKLGLAPCICWNPAVSPDGSRVALQVLTPDIKHADLWVWSLAQRTLMRLSFEPGLQDGPLWTPDSMQIAYRSMGTREIVLRHADGTGAAEPLLEGDGPGTTPWAWTREGELIFAELNAPGFGVLPVGVDRKPRFILSTSKVWSAALSPDGHWLAYQSSETGRDEIYVSPYPGVDGGKWQISADGGQEPKWTPDGRTLFFLGPKSLMGAGIETAPAFTARTPEPVLDRSGYVFILGPPRSYDISPDGKRFLLVKQVTTDADTKRLVIVQNWLAALDQRNRQRDQK